MIKLEISVRTCFREGTWWFVEWPEGGEVSPAKEVKLLELVYEEMKYKGTVGFCVQYPVERFERSETLYNLEKQANYHVMFVDEFYYYAGRPEDESMYYQRQNYEHIVGMAFKDRESAELFKHKIEARWTFKALQADYH